MHSLLSQHPRSLDAVASFSKCSRIYPKVGTQIFNQGGENCISPYQL